MPLFSNEELEDMQARYAQRLAEQLKQRAAMNALSPKPYQPRSVAQWEVRVPKTKREILLECLKEFPGISIQELADGAGRSQRWVRQVLRENGVTLPARNSRNPAPAEGLLSDHDQ